MSGTPVAIVTGGAQGLGAAMCVELLKKGYKVCVADLKEDKGKQFVKEQREKYGADHVEFIVCDVTKEKDYKEIFDFALKKFESIDLVVNNAGILLEQDPRQTIDVNLMGPITGCQLALHYMGKSQGGKGGMVINTASILGFLPYYPLPAYVASKHGVIGLTRSYGLPYYLEREGVLFTAICPSYVDTEMVRTAQHRSLDPCLDPTQKSQEFMSPQYVAEGISKLLEDRVNGSALLVTKKGYKYVGYQSEFEETASFI